MSQTPSKLFSIIHLCVMRLFEFWLLNRTAYEISAMLLQFEFKLGHGASTHWFEPNSSHWAREKCIYLFFLYIPMHSQTNIPELLLACMYCLISILTNLINVSGKCVAFTRYRLYWLLDVGVFLGYFFAVGM